jgi:adenylate cyclase
MLTRYLFLIFALYLTSYSLALALTNEVNNGPIESIGERFFINNGQKVSNGSKNLKFGYFNDKKSVEITLENPSDKPLEKVLFFDTISGKINLVQIDDQAVNMVGGSSTPYNLRPVRSIFGAFPINLAPHSNSTYNFEITSRHNFNSEVKLTNINVLNELETNRIIFLLFYSGGIVSLIIYNFFIFVSLRDVKYLYYCFFAASFMLAVLNINGVLDRLFQPSSFSFSHYLICFSSTALMSAIAFSIRFLQINENFKKLKWFYHTIFAMTAFLFVSGLTSFEDKNATLAGHLIDILILVANVSFLINSVQLYRISSSARYYLLSWVIIVLSIMSWFAMTFGLIPHNFFSQYALLFGNLGQMITISLALAHRIVDLTEQKRLAEERAHQKEMYQRLVRVLSHDITNSLSVIGLYSKRLLTTSSDKETHLNAEKIFIANKNIINILSNVREQELLPIRKNNMVKMPINIKESLISSAQLFEEQLKYKNISINIDVPENIFIQANATNFTNNIVNNIISNSIKFSYEGSHIEIYAELENKNAKLVFHDQGRGIKKDAISPIFFENNPTTSSGTFNEPGHGFGAYLIREYTEIFGGKLEVFSIHESESPINSGTTIYLTFPITNAPSAS